MWIVYNFLDNTHYNTFIHSHWLLSPLKFTERANSSANCRRTLIPKVQTTHTKWKTYNTRLTWPPVDLPSDWHDYLHFLPLLQPLVLWAEAFRKFKYPCERKIFSRVAHVSPVLAGHYNVTSFWSFISQWINTTVKLHFSLLW